MTLPADSASFWNPHQYWTMTLMTLMTLKIHKCPGEGRIVIPFVTLDVPAVSGSSPSRSCPEDMGFRAREAPVVSRARPNLQLPSA